MRDRALERLIEAADDFLGVFLDRAVKDGDVSLFSERIEEARDALKGAHNDGGDRGDV